MTNDFYYKAQDFFNENNIYIYIYIYDDTLSLGQNLNKILFFYNNIR